MRATPRKLLRRAGRGLIRLAGFQIQLQQDVGHLAAGVRLRMLLQQRDGLRILLPERQNLRFQQQRRSARAVHSQRPLDQLFSFLALAAVKQPLRVT